MRSAQVMAVRALLLGALLASAGCFRPKITPGGFSCGNNGACPDGLVCNPANQLCVSSLDGGMGGKGGTGGKGGAGGPDGGPPDVPPDRPCTGAIASCPRTDAGLCDPVCNTGCGECYQKCSVNTAGALTCNAPTTGSPGLLGACAQTDFGSRQTDNCGPGQVCIAPRGNGCLTRCYQFCRTNSDCTNGATCSIDAGGGNSLCDVPPAACDPVLHAAASSQWSHCTGNGFIGCYLSSDSLTTLCDCQDSPPPPSVGSVGQACNRSRDCFAGLVCYDPTGHDNKTCRKVCRLPGDGGVDLTRTDAGEQGCSNNDPSLCLPILLSNGTLSTTYGFCND